jgi:hypothetical protein
MVTVDFECKIIFNTHNSSIPTIYSQIDQLAEYESISDNMLRNSIEVSTKDKIFKSERDTWSLLRHFLSNDIIHDLELNAMFDANGIDVLWSDEELRIQIDHDQQMKKSRVALAWLESSFPLNVFEYHKPSKAPWSNTLNAIMNKIINVKPGTKSLTSVHPDAQIDYDGLLIDLVGSDNYDQESLLKYMWKLIRKGMLQEALYLAKDCDLFWLAASLHGAILPTHHLVPYTGVDGVGSGLYSVLCTV